jgi:hypothetical protein
VRLDLTYLESSPSTLVTFLSPNRGFDTMPDSDLQAVTRYLEDNQQVIYAQGTGFFYFRG